MHIQVVEEFLASSMQKIGPAKRFAWSTELNWRLARANLDPLVPDADLCLGGLPVDSPAPKASCLDLIRQRLASDEELAQQLQGGNADALTVLFKRHSPLLFGIARRILRNDAEAEDAVQQIFLDVFRSIRQFDLNKGTFKNWLLIFAYQRTFNSRRSQIAKKFFDTDSLEDGAGIDGGAIAKTWAYSPAENNILVEQVLSALQPRQRRTIELIYREGFTAEEVAAHTGESVRVVRHNLYRSLEKLRKVFSDPK